MPVYKVCLKDDRVVLLVIVLLAITARLIAFAVFGDQGFPDTRAYWRAGKNLIENGLIGNTHAMPLYAIVSYAMGKWLPFLDILISSLTIIVVYLIALEIDLGRFAALLAAFIVSLYPHFIFFSFAGLTETIYVFVVCLSFFLLYRQRFFLASVIIVLSILIRPTFDFLAPILIFVFAIFVHRLGWARTTRNLLIYGFVYALLMAPWWMHNYSFYGQFVRLNLGDGTVWYAGNNPMNKSGGGIEGGKNPDVDFSRFRQIDEPLERNEALKKEAFEFIKDNPERFVELAGLKFIRFWRLWPHTDQYQSPLIIAASLLSYGVFLLLSVVFLAKEGWARRRTILPVLLFMGYLTAVHMILIASVRYRLPVEPFIIIFGSYPLAQALTRLFPKLPSLLGVDEEG